MSRIHEALKKAEQEKISGVVTDVTPTPSRELSETIQPGSEWAVSRPGIAGELNSANAVVAARSGDFLRFDDLRASCAHPLWRMDPNVNVFFNPQLSVHGAEQFRTLRSRLYQLRGTQTLQTLLITSSVPGEGKTFVTTNLAQAIVRQPDRRALIIDADLRRPRVHTLLGAPSSPGLSDYLRGEFDEMSVIQHGQEGNLCFIPGGSEVTNPSELLLNGRLKKLVEKLAPIFDWVILDSPPCLPVADATILADVCDGVLLVARAGLTPASTALRACQEMRGKNLLGVVLNAMQESHLAESYYYQGYGYGYGRDDRGDSAK